MIIGIGSDITNISRFERSIKAYGVRLIDRALGEKEKAELEQKEFISPQEYAASVAKRFAAKEACSKALGTGFRNGIYLSQIQTVHNKNGKPEIVLSGKALEQFQKLCGGKIGGIHLSISDDYPWAQAVVIIEQLG